MTRFDIDSIPGDKLSWIDIVHYILVTPHLLLIVVIMIGFMIMFVFGFWSAVQIAHINQMEYCANLKDTVNFTGVGC